MSKVTSIHLPICDHLDSQRRLHILDSVWVHKVNGDLFLIHEDQHVKIAECLENPNNKTPMPTKDTEIYTWVVKKLSERVSAVKKTISRLNEEKHVACKELDLLTGIQKSMWGLNHGMQ